MTGAGLGEDSRLPEWSEGAELHGEDTGVAQLLPRWDGRRYGADL